MAETKPITLFRGDDSDAFGLRTMTIKLTGDLDLNDATAKFTLLGYTKTWTNAETKTGTLTMTMSAADTKGMPLGPAFGKIWLYDIEGAEQGDPGKRLTICNTIPFFITDKIDGLKNEEFGIDVKLAVDTDINITFIAEGTKGEKGDAATIAVGTTTTGAPGTSAIVTNVGDEHSAIFNFTIPRGDQGITRWTIDGNTLKPQESNITNVQVPALANVNALGNRYTLADVKNLVNTILSALKVQEG